MDPRANIRKLRMVRPESSRTVSREVGCYSLPAILAVGDRVRSPRVPQFRQWATDRLNEYLVNGFVTDDHRLKHPRGKVNAAHFEELLEAIRTYKGSFHSNRFNAAALVAHAAAMGTSNSSPTLGRSILDLRENYPDAERESDPDEAPGGVLQGCEQVRRHRRRRMRQEPPVLNIPTSDRSSPSAPLPVLGRILSASGDRLSRYRI